MRYAVPVLLAFAALFLRLPGPAAATPKIAVHVQPHSTGKAVPCDAGPEFKCSSFETSAALNTGYDVYVVAAEGTPAGVGGATFGIEYGADVGRFGYGLCGDLEFPGGGWPASGGGNLITFDVINNCQTSSYGEGVQAQLCWFYLYAYGAGDFDITPRNYVPTPDLKVADCTAAEVSIPLGNAGSIAFSAGGATSGENPCTGSPGDFTPPLLLGAQYLDTPAPHRIVLSFNENMGGGADDPANYEVFLTGLPSSVLPIVGAVTAGNQVTLTLGSTVATPGMQYTVRVNNAEDLAGNPIAPNSTVSFTRAGADLTPPTLVSASYFEFSNRAVVQFSEDLGTGAGTASNYEVYELANSGNTLSFTANHILGSSFVELLFSTEPQPGTTYTVRVNNVEDTAGNPILPNSAIGFTTPAGDVTPPTLASASYSEFANAVTLQFNEAVAAGASDASNYEVFETATPGNTVGLTVSHTGGSAFVILHFTAVPAPGTQHTVRVNHVEDVAGNPIAPNSTLFFTTPTPDLTPPTLDSATYQPVGNTIDLVFSEILGAGAGTTTNYAVFRSDSAGSATVTGAAVSGAGVTLSLGSTLLPNTPYTVRVNNVEDTAGNAVAPDSEAYFTTPGLDLVPPHVTNVSATLNVNSVLVTYSEPMGGNVTNVSNYAVARAGSPLTISSINLLSPQLVQILLTQGLQPGTHTVAITQVEDVAGNAIADTTVGFTLAAPPPSGGPRNPVLALHVQAALTGKAEDRCAAAPTSTCNQFWSEGQLATPYDLYVVLVSDYVSGGSLAGATFGVDYGGGLSVTQWASCGDLEFPGGGWPASGGGNLVTFDATSNCQVNNRSFVELHATIGVFYVYAYAIDSFSITPRLYVPTPDLKAADCNAAESSIPYPQGAGTVGFGIYGYNPCNGGAAPIEPTTWGSIKRQFSQEGNTRAEP